MIRKTKIVLISFGIVLFIGVLAFAKFSTSKLVHTVAKAEVSEEFSSDNMNVLKVDSFSKIAQKAYGNQLSISQKDQELILNLIGENVSQFYNNQTALLTIKNKGFRIEIKEKTLTARFKIKNNGVHVPNDVILNMVKRIQL